MTRSDGLHRFDVTPAIRFPFNKLAFLAVNTTARFPNTFWSDSLVLDPLTGTNIGYASDAPISRHFVELSAEVNGPTFVKI